MELGLEISIRQHTSKDIGGVHNQKHRSLRQLVLSSKLVQNSFQNAKNLWETVNIKKQRVDRCFT